MKATVIHNPTAGAGGLKAKQLLDALESAGFEHSYYSTKDDSFRARLQDPGDLVVAAGGDGTVVKVAREMRGSEVPTVIVPAGTANNIGTSLGLPLDPIAALERGISGVIRHLDLGIVGTGKGRRIFLEGVGFGLFPAVLESIHERDDDQIVEVGGAETGLRHDLARWLSVLPAVEPRFYDLVADGDDLSGEYLMVEVMNLPVLGPNLPFAPRASPTDGVLDLVLATAADRVALHGFLDSRARHGSGEWSLPARRASQVRIGWNDAIPRLDDDLWRKAVRRRIPATAPHTLSVTVQHDAFAVSVPI